MLPFWVFGASCRPLTPTSTSRQHLAQVVLDIPLETLEQVALDDRTPPASTTTGNPAARTAGRHRRQTYGPAARLGVRGASRGLDGVSGGRWPGAPHAREGASARRHGRQTQAKAAELTGFGFARAVASCSSELRAPARAQVIGRQVHLKPKGSTRRLTREHPAHSRTPVLLRFLVRLPSTTATGRWRERGRMVRRR